MPLRDAAVAIGLCFCAACAHPRPATAPDPSVIAQRNLDAAATLVRAGCLDCLEEAFRLYESVSERPTVSPPLIDQAVMGSLRTALLIELRQRLLGMSEGGYLQRAQARLATNPDIDQAIQTLVTIIGTIPWRSAGIGGAGADPAGPQRFRLIRDNRVAWLDLLRARADQDELFASVWLVFSCANSFSAERQHPVLTAALPTLNDAPIVRYELSTCGAIDDQTLNDLLRSESRFNEIEFWLGMRDLAQQRLDEAQTHLTTAYDWDSDWPSAALALAGVYMTGEDLLGALRLYEATLALSPDMPDAIIGRVRALSYLGRYADALESVAHLERIQWLPGEAAYWRAWNESRLDRIEDAWTHVQHAERLWVTSDVSKLAGIIAVARGELAVARGRFETARELNPGDCETLVYLGGVQADLRDWAPSAAAFVAAAACLQEAKAEFARQIAALEASGGAPERVARQTASRRQQLATADRMLAQSWFNAAADHFNLAHKAEAREYAEKVLDDPQFGARARDLIAKLGN